MGFITQKDSIKPDLNNVLLQKRRALEATRCLLTWKFSLIGEVMVSHIISK